MADRMRKTRVAIAGKAQGPRTTYTQHVGHVPARSKYSPHAGAKQLARAEKKAAEAQQRYAMTRSHVALVRMRDAVTEALKQS